MSAKVEQRTTRDGGPPIWHVTRAARATTAIRPLLEAVQRLDASLDRAAKRVEDARRAKAEKRLRAVVDQSAQRIYGGIAAKERQAERERFQRKLFGRRLPRTLAERLGLVEVPE
jgi:hypothetical protein